MKADGETRDRARAHGHLLGAVLIVGAFVLNGLLESIGLYPVVHGGARSDWHPYVGAVKPSWGGDDDEDDD